MKMLGSRSMHWTVASLIACQYFSRRICIALLVRADQQLGGIGEWAGLRLDDGLVDLALGFLLPARDIDLGADALGDELARGRDDRVAGDPALDFFPATVAGVPVPERADVLAPAVGDRLDEVWPLAALAPVGGLARRLVDGEDVVAVDLLGGHAVRLRPLPDLDVPGLAHRQRRVRGEAVVAAGEDDGELLDDGEVQRLVEDALLTDAVAEERDGRPRQAVHLEGPGRADRRRHRLAEDGRRRDVADLGGVQVDRAAAPLAAAVDAAIQLGNHAEQAAGLGQVLGVAAIAA